MEGSLSCGQPCRGILPRPPALPAPEKRTAGPRTAQGGPDGLAPAGEGGAPVFAHIRGAGLRPWPIRRSLSTFVRSQIRTSGIFGR